MRQRFLTEGVSANLPIATLRKIVMARKKIESRLTYISFFKTLCYYEFASEKRLLFMSGNDV